MTYRIKGIKFTCVRCHEKEAIARKLCRPCYKAVRKNGLLGEYAVLEPKDVFESRIDKTKNCWIWTGTKNSYGYGVFLMPGEKAVRAHRYAYEFFVGPIPDGMIIRHSCDNPPCVNPAHLQIGTKAENNADTAERHRHNYATDHWNGRLTRADIQYVLNSNKTQVILAKELGVCQSHISRIKSGQHRRTG